MMGTNLCAIHSIASTRVDHGGTSRSVPALCDHLVSGGLCTQLIAGRSRGAHVGFLGPEKAGVSWVDEHPIHRHIGLARRFRRVLHGCLSSIDGPVLVHDHGIWLGSNHGVAGLCRERSVPRIVSPRGMLTSWSLNHGRIKKRLAWWWYQRADLLSAIALHATSMEELDDCRASGLGQPVAVIPNGVTCPSEEIIQRCLVRQHDVKRVAFLSRIHPKKGLCNLLQAWHAIAPDKRWRLVIAGNDEDGHLAEVKRLAQRLSIESQVDFVGTINDLDKWKFYGQADLFVLPSFSENFGIVVAEAMAARLPVIATHGTPWQGLASHSAGWHVPPTIDGIAGALRQGISLSDEQRQQMGYRGQRWVQDEFSWGGVSRQMIRFYEWLTLGGERPEWVFV